MKSRSRCGVTLIELLVVMAIVTVLVALCLPAVQQIRETARRANCASNLRQIGLALHNYHDVHGVFPDFGSEFIGDWPVVVLPFIGEQPLFDAFDFGARPDAPHNIDIARRSRPAIYRCPSAVTDESSVFGAGQAIPVGHAFMNSNVMGKKMPLDDISGTFLLQESPQDPGFLSPWILGPSFPVPFPPASGPPNHTGGANLFFLDGHIEFTRHAK